MTNTKTIYIAGPMRGYPQFNFPAFDAASRYLQSQGWRWILSPAEADREIGFDPAELPNNTDWNHPEKLGFDMRLAVRRCVDAVLRSDAIYMLRGWEKSRGAIAEYHLACWLGLEILFEAENWKSFTLTTVPSSALNQAPSTKNQEPNEDILAEAMRITGASGDRQASYGPPDQDFRRTADMWTALKGTKFEPWEVAQFMIALKLSRETHQAKRDNCVDIAGYARCLDVCRQVERKNAQ